MRVLIIIAGAAIALGGCNRNGQGGDVQNADDNLTAASIVSNDVTAIDAVTGDAANMAADVDMNYGDLSGPDNRASPEGNPSSSTNRSPRDRLREEAPPTPEPTTSSTGNTVSNKE